LAGKSTISMPGRLTFICHGATAATRTSAFPLDEPLEDGGAEQARVLGHSLRRWDRAMTSPALPARQTAEALALDAVVDPALRDCDYGHWCGRKLADIQAAHPADVAAWLCDPAAAPHGGESLLALMARVSDWMADRLRDEGHTIVVTHAAVIRAAVVNTLAAPPEAFWRVDIEPLSWVGLRSDNRRWALRIAVEAGGTSAEPQAKEAR
jgi:broad specificity phosphatase PhoE